MLAVRAAASSRRSLFADPSVRSSPEFLSKAPSQSYGSSFVKKLRMNTLGMMILFPFSVNLDTLCIWNPTQWCM